MFHKADLTKLSGQQLSDCTDALSMQTVPEDHIIRIIAGVFFAVEPKDTTVEMFNALAILLCKEWNRRYKVLKAWMNSEIPDLNRE
jgi:hypothetical protein